MAYNAGDRLAASPELLADVAVDLDQIITRRKVRDWTRNPDVQNRMRDDIEDYLYDLRDRAGIALPTADIDRILDAIMELAKQRERLA